MSFCSGFKCFLLLLAVLAGSAEECVYCGGAKPFCMVVLGTSWVAALQCPVLQGRMDRAHSGSLESCGCRAWWSLEGICFV